MTGPKQSPAQIEADIERQRDELAATVSELQTKLDVKARAQGKVRELKNRATTDTGKPRTDITVVAVVAVAAVVGLIIWRSRR